MLSVVFSSCGIKGEASPQEKINTRLKQMQSYEAVACLKRFDGKEETQYTVRQCWQSDGKYRLEILEPEKYKGNYTVYNGSEICQYNPRVKDSIIHNVPENMARNQLFVGEFAKNYFNSENVSCAVAKFDESKCTVIEAVIPGGNKYTATEKLWMDNETIIPVKLVLYDSEGKERYTLEFESFEYDVQFENGTFEAAN